MGLLTEVSASSQMSPRGGKEGDCPGQTVCRAETSCPNQFPMDKKVLVVISTEESSQPVQHLAVRKIVVANKRIRDPISHHPNLVRGRYPLTGVMVSPLAELAL